MFFASTITSNPITKNSCSPWEKKVFIYVKESIGQFLTKLQHQIVQLFWFLTLFAVTSPALKSFRILLSWDDIRIYIHYFWNIKCTNNQNIQKQ